MILITGGSGFLGRELIKKLNGSNIRVMARGYKELLRLKEDHPDIEIQSGDVADECAVRKALKGVDKVYHLAAYKHVGQAQKEPRECMLTNIGGTNLLLENFKGSEFVFISTDKAAQVNGVYGASKYICEQLVYEASLVKDVKYTIVRYGNVLYSTGSVLPKWKKLIEANKPITITNQSATRFFFTVEQAVDLIFKAEENGQNGIPFIPKIKSMTMGNLAASMIKKYGGSESEAVIYSMVHTGITVTKLAEGENMHETMDGEVFSDQVEQYTRDEIMRLI